MRMSIGNIYGGIHLVKQGKKCLNESFDAHNYSMVSIHYEILSLSAPQAYTFR